MHARNTFTIATVLLASAAGASADQIEPLRVAEETQPAFRLSLIDPVTASTPLPSALSVSSTPSQSGIPVPTPGAGALAAAGLLLAARRRRAE